jgi:hypothetical protein
MTIYIKPNLTVFPTTEVLSAESIQNMTWLGFSESTTAEQISAAGYIAVEEPIEQQPADSVLAVSKSESGEYTASWILLDDYQQLLDTNAAAGFARNRRNRLLEECDWTQAKDIPDAVSSQWTEYRQALRDITNQEGFPNAIIWPEKP